MGYHGRDEPDRQREEVRDGHVGRALGERVRRILRRDDSEWDSELPSRFVLLIPDVIEQRTRVRYEHSTSH